jgi:hypothetical protein
MSEELKGTNGIKLKKCIFELKGILHDISAVVENTCQKSHPEDRLDQNDALLLISKEKIEKLINWLENN